MNRTSFVWFSSGLAGSLAFCFNFSMIPAANAGVLDDLFDSINKAIYRESASSEAPMNPRHKDWDKPGFGGNPDAVPQPTYLWDGSIPKLSAEKFGTMQHLGWPQNRIDMHGTFGKGFSEGNKERYRTPYGQNLYVIYDGNNATGYKIW